MKISWSKSMTVDVMQEASDTVYPFSSTIEVSVEMSADRTERRRLMLRLESLLHEAVEKVVAALKAEESDRTRTWAKKPANRGW